MFSSKRENFVSILAMNVAVCLFWLGGCGGTPPYEANQILQRAGVADAVVFEGGDDVDVMGDVPEMLTQQEAVRRALATSPELRAAIWRRS